MSVSLIPHHQGAVEIAKVELSSGTDPRLRRLAQEIIVPQQAEVAFKAKRWSLRVVCIRPVGI